MIGLPSGKRRLIVVLALACAALLPGPVRAQTSDEQLERAKARFREGNALLRAGDPERALERFLQSRELVPSGKNTANAAICLERLGRYDEALEMYEELLARFAEDLDQQDRASLAPIMASLRGRLGSLELSANVDGQLTVDGKPRGRLPRMTALRVMPGKRRIRVAREGYESVDVIVEVEAGKTLSVDASLKPLSGTGGVRVEVTGNAAGNLWIDGKPVGLVPWEGSLKPGMHLAQFLGQDFGSRPEKLEVLEGKTLLVRVSAVRLGPPLTLEVEPRTASLSVDGVELGSGSWSGRLPLGKYSVRATETGYFDYLALFDVRAPPASDAVRITLLRDPTHPRWPRKIPWRVGVGLGGALMYAPSLHGDQEAQCPDLCVGSVAAWGGRFEAALELIHDRGFGVELGLGYLLMRQHFTRAAFSTYDAGQVTYALEQEMLLGGFYGRIAGIALLPLGHGFRLRTAVGAGLLNAVFDATSDGMAWTTGEPVEAGGTNLEPISELTPLVTTSIAFEHHLGPIELSLGVAAWFFPTQGPKFSGAQLSASPDCDPTDLEAVGCAPASDLLASEHVHGPFAALSPELGARYRF